MEKNSGPNLEPCGTPWNMGSKTGKRPSKVNTLCPETTMEKNKTEKTA